VVTATSNGTQLKINLTTLIYGSREFSLLTYGDVSSFDANSNAINTLVSGMSFGTAVVNGVNRNQALFLEGGESTNPRDYDPATEHDSGDKRLYSGLVSLDAKLHLVADLAQSWDVSAGGTVYTFHLRPNAKFQDGRLVAAQLAIQPSDLGPVSGLERISLAMQRGDGRLDLIAAWRSTVQGLGHPRGAVVDLILMPPRTVLVFGGPLGPNPTLMRYV